MQTIEQLEEQLSRPTSRLVEMMRRLQGDVLFLGAGGKMGPTMCRMAKRASDEAGVGRRVIGVSRFGDNQLRQQLEDWGIETHSCDLLDEQAVEGLPDAPHVVYLAGMKFGASQDQPRTWAMNCFLPSIICRKYRQSRIAAFSTGNVYGMVASDSHGSVETDPPRPDGEYAMSCLGRERMFQYFSQSLSIPVALLRLNYATELRYGVLVDLAQAVAAGQPVDLAMGRVNVIWQADANAMALCALDHCETGGRILNLAGPEILAVRDIAIRLGELMGRPAKFLGEPAERAFLNDGRNAYPLLGTPETPVEEMLAWTADWIRNDRPTLGKPTHFQVQDGKF